MRGVDITDKQMRHAEQLYRVAAKDRADEDPINIKRDQVIRLMAWYAAIRLEAVKPGSSKADGGVFVEAPHA